MIEAMACGTPIIAFRRGSAPEVIEENVSGFLVNTIEEAVAALWRIQNLDRIGVRAEFERRFTAERMARDYVGIYRQLLALCGRPATVAMNGAHTGWQALRQRPSTELRGSNGEGVISSAVKSRRIEAVHRNVPE
jgi:hypothetical protein